MTIRLMKLGFTFPPILTLIKKAKSEQDCYETVGNLVFWTN